MRAPCRVVSIARSPMLVSVSLALSVFSACDKGEDNAGEPASEVSAPPAPEAAPAPEPEPPNMSASDAERSAPEACAKGVFVAHAESSDGPEGIERDSSAAREKAEALRAEALEGATTINALAERDSDDPRSQKKRGAIGTYARDAWPEMYEGLDAPLWATRVGGISEVVETPRGFAFAERCEIDKVHTRHILIRYVGAERSTEETKRSKDAAKARAKEAHAKIAGGEDFATVAAKYGEDSTAENGG